LCWKFNNLERFQNRRPIMKSVTFHIVEGGLCSPQSAPLEMALLEVKKKVAMSGITLNYEIKRRKDVRENADMTPFSLVKWLSDAHAHIIATHPSQANTHFWNVTDVIDALDTLKIHPGFPCNEQIECPVFTQHKYKYLNLLPKYMMTPTYAVPLNFPGQLGTIEKKSLTTFLMDNDEGHGWVVKMPFVTNRDKMHHCKTLEMVIHTIENYPISASGIPYCMVQPRLENTKEYKLAFIGGTFSHIIPHARGTGEGYCDENILRAFAEAAMSAIKSSCPETITDGLFRVDIMRRANGNLVVNEFESLEAMAYGRIHQSHEELINSFLENYWTNIIMSIVVALTAD